MNVDTVTETDPSQEQLRSIDRALDRLEQRLWAAPHGMHVVGGSRDPQDPEFRGFPMAARPLWTRFDGLDLASGEARIFALDAVGLATRESAWAEVALPSDWVIGERGRDLMVVPEDPWAEGADVVAVTEDGDRHPEAASVAHLALGWVAEVSVLYDEHGEFREGLFGDDGEITSAGKRRLLRRRLDVDPDATRARMGLGVELRQAGEFRAARAELNAALRRAPDYAEARHELGRVLDGLGRGEEASREHDKAAACAGDPASRAYYLAWAILTAAPSAQMPLRKRLLHDRPEFAVRQLQGAQARVAREEWEEAAELCVLGLAAVPTHAPLLALHALIRTAQRPES